MLKLNVDGEFGWAHNLGGSAFGTGSGLAVGPDGTVHVVGRIFDGVAKTLVATFDTDGVPQWTRSFDNSGGNAVAVDGAGNVHVTGFFTGTVDFDPGKGTANLTAAGVTSDVFVLKLDSNGDLVWVRSFGGGAVSSTGIAVDASANVFTVGTFRAGADFDPGVGTDTLSSGGVDDAFVSKLDSNGDLAWARSFGGPSNDIALDRDDQTQAFLDAALHRDDSEVMSKEELLAALDQEVVLENRPPAGSDSGEDRQ